MRCLQPLVLACALFAGCLATRPDTVVSKYEPNERESAGEGEPGSIALFVALAERPVGDRYLNQGLWEFADEQTIFQHDLDCKAILEQNGFRVGMLGGSPTPAFQSLLNPRNCPNPRCIRLHPGSPTHLDIGDLWPNLNYQVIYKDRPHPISLEKALCRLQVLPHLDGPERIRLIFTPQVRHGQQTLLPRPVMDPDGSRRWDSQARHPEENYPWMSWSVTLGTNDYLIIGGRLERNETLGRRMFLHTESQTTVQRVLVLRTLRTEPRKDLGRKDSVSPLAAQAQSVPTPRVRGLAPSAGE